MQFGVKASKSLPSPQEIKSTVREALVENHIADSHVENIPPDPVIDEKITPGSKLSQLVDDQFPFDESQLNAVNGMSSQQYGCLTGAAGTGKTTTTKKLVDTLIRDPDAAVRQVDLRVYWKRTEEARDDQNDMAEADGYEMVESVVPAVANVAFTGRATQQIKRNFPRDWHGNIMTIHRLLGFYPVWGEYEDVDTQEIKKRMLFKPFYDSSNKLPWDIIVIDEAGMLGLDLWHQLWAACRPDTRIYMIGDINQLPPVHGRSVFGFAMAKWPSWELTHIHRQKGSNNRIVDNAWRVLKGLPPVSDGNFQMLELKGDAQLASRFVRKLLPGLRERKIYDPVRDAVITPINGEEGSRGFALGQLPLNRELSLIFNPRTENPRYMIDGGRERKQFAVGDKVMATKNDYEAGITNGMTGIICEISEHAGYTGERERFGRLEDVEAYMREENNKVDDNVEFSLEDLEDSFEAIDEATEKKKESRERGPSSHIVTVQFGDDEHGFQIPFQSLSEVGSLMTAYVMTCHKLQGGEAPVIIIILHDAHKAMLYREWLYTAITRASQKCILLYTPTALRTALNKQSIKGSSLTEKVAAFNRMQDPKGLLGASVKVKLPSPASMRGDVVLAGPQNAAKHDDSLKQESNPQPKKSLLDSLIGKTVTVKIVKETIHRTEHVSRIEIVTPTPEGHPTKDGGDLQAEPKSTPKMELLQIPAQKLLEDKRVLEWSEVVDWTLPMPQAIQIMDKPKANPMAAKLFGIKKG